MGSEMCIRDSPYGQRAWRIRLLAPRPAFTLGNNAMAGILQADSPALGAGNIPAASKRKRRPEGRRRYSGHAAADYSTIADTIPAPTVRPPSRIAKRSFSSIAIGTISATSIVTLSPGMTISVPSGSVTMPVTSVVRK